MEVLQRQLKQKHSSAEASRESKETLNAEAKQSRRRNCCGCAEENDEELEAPASAPYGPVDKTEARLKAHEDLKALGDVEIVDVVGICEARPKAHEDLEGSSRRSQQKDLCR